MHISIDFYDANKWINLILSLHLEKFIKYYKL